MKNLFISALVFVLAASFSSDTLAHTDITSEPSGSATTSIESEAELETTGIEHEDIGITTEEEAEAGTSAQHNESDLNFMTELSTTGGVYIKYDDVEGESTKTSDEGDPDQPVITGAADSEVSVVGVEVRGWDPDKKNALKAVDLHLADLTTQARLAIRAAQTASADAQVEEITLNFGKIKFDYLFPVKLLGFINTQMRYEVSVEFDNQEEIHPDEYSRVKVKLPWWHIFSRKLVNAENLRVDIEGDLTAASNIEMQNSIQRNGYILESVSATLKTRHDTAKNAVANVR